MGLHISDHRPCAELAATVARKVRVAAIAERASLPRSERTIQVRARRRSPWWWLRSFWPQVYASARLVRA